MKKSEIPAYKTLFKISTKQADKEKRPLYGHTPFHISDYDIKRKLRQKLIRKPKEKKQVEKSEFNILVAEDDAMVRDVIGRFLKDEKYNVFMAEDGLAAIKLLRVKDIKLVITDLRMPGADGMEVLRTAISMNPRISVVLMTAYGTLDTALEAMKEGAYDYILKPFVMQQLLILVRNAFKMANLVEENESLSSQLREIYRDLEELKASGSVGVPVPEYVEPKKKSGSDSVKKYSSLAKEVKNWK